MTPGVNPLVFKSDTKRLLEKAKVKFYIQCIPCFLGFFLCLYYSANIENAFVCDMEIGRLCEFSCPIHQEFVKLYEQVMLHIPWPTETKTQIPVK